MCRRAVLTVALAFSTCGCSPGNRYRAGLVEHSIRSRAPYSDWVSLSSLRPLHGPSAARPHDLQVMAQRVMPAVVYVTTVPHRPAIEHQPNTTCQPTRSRYGGTGVIINGKGMILTCAHVVEQATAVTVTLADGSELPVQHVTIDPKYDLAVLYTGASGLRPLVLAKQGTAEGAAVVALCGPKPGHARRPGKRARVGKVEGTSRSLQHLLATVGSRDYRNLIETTAVLDPGFSGGPLLDADGHLVGINVAAIPKNASHGPRGYAIPVNRQTIKAFELAGFESHPHFLCTDGKRSLPGT